MFWIFWTVLVVTCTVWREKSTCWTKSWLFWLKLHARYGRMGLKASISVISQLPTFHNPHKKKNQITSTESQTTAPHHSLTSLQTIHFILSLSFSLPVGVGNNSYYFKSNQEFHFPISSSNQISSTPPLLQTLHFTLSLSLYPLATTTSRLFQSSNQTKIFTFPCL